MSVMNPIPAFLRVFDAYCEATGIGEQRNSTLILNAGHRIVDLRAGGNVSIRVLERAVQRMSDTWPDQNKHLWPRDVPRPPRSKRQNQTELVAAR